MAFQELKINRYSTEEGSWSWINIVVNAVSDFRIQTIIIGNYNGVLHRSIDAQTFEYIGEIVGKGDVIKTEERRVLYIVITKGKGTLIDNVEVQSRLWMFHKTPLEATALAW